MRFAFPAGHGYRISVEAWDSTAILDVSRHHRRHAGAFTDYYARARLRGNRIEAGFGSLGAISMRFEPSGRVSRGPPQRGCRGPDRTTTRLGVFVGSFRFRGEDGYVSADVKRVKGDLLSPRFLECASPAIPSHHLSHHPTKPVSITLLEAGFRQGVDAVHFYADRGRDHSARYEVFTEHSEGQLAIGRFAFAIASPLTFATDDALSFASVSPPAPFSGTGSLERNPDGSRTWSGSLAASFPGAPDVPLTGSQFKTQLARNL